MTEHETPECVICGEQARTYHLKGDSTYQGCPRCGEFEISRTLITILRKSYPKDHEARAKLSGWVRKCNMLGEAKVPIGEEKVNSYKFDEIKAIPIPGILERANRLLEFVVHRHRQIGESFNRNYPAFLAVTYSKDKSEVAYLFDFLREEGFIIYLEKGWARITPKGHMRYEELHARQVASTQGFVAMWFDDSMKDVYEKGFKDGIKNAGYKPIRIDQKEHSNKIDDEIIAEIRRSRFVVADFTGHRGGVYFEAGFALGFNIPVIWTCRKDCFDDLHFDIRQYNCIVWDKPEDLAERLKKRIQAEAVVGTGPEVSD